MGWLFLGQWLLMKVLMLGWEYPPHISGGLGTACEGLSTALSRAGVELTFVVPHLYGGEMASHMMLLGSSNEIEKADSSVTSGRKRKRTGSINTVRIPSS